MISITSIGHDGVYGLYDKNNKPVKAGAILFDNRNGIHVVKSAQAPQKASSTGSIHTNKGYYCPSVFDCELVNIHPDSVVSPIQAS